MDWNVHHVPRSKLTVEQCARRVHGNNICGDNHNYFYIWLIAQCHLSPYLGGGGGGDGVVMVSTPKRFHTGEEVASVTVAVANPQGVCSN